jgi:hypothetical protein
VVAVEIEPRAEALIDPRLTRRLIALELADVEFRRSPDDPESQTLFFRVLADSKDELRVELWERGEVFGARSVAGARDKSQLGARRIALAAAELARRLQNEHEDRKARREREARRLKRVLYLDKLRRRSLRQSLTSMASGAVFGPMDGWLAGPRLGFQVPLAPDFGLEFSARWLFGAALDEGQGSSLSWLEVGAGPFHRWALDERLELRVGAEFSAASLHLGGAHAVDDIAGQTATWSARAALTLRLEPLLASGIRLSFGPDVGSLLRPVFADFGRRERTQLSGVWLGASFGVAFETLPSPTLNPRPTSARAGRATD